LRTTFNTVADYYHRVRPPLPDGLVDELLALAAAPPAGRVLEVGPGTGRGTIEFARRGYDVTGIELGDALAEVARHNLALYPNARIHVGSFEGWQLPAEPFDVVTAFDAWHWLDPTVALDKAAAALRPGGALATVGGQGVEGGDTSFFHDVQDCYERYMPGTPPGLRLSKADDVPHHDRGTGNHPEFDAPMFRRWVQIVEYSADEYIEFMSTASSHIALPREDREALLACIRARLESEYGSRVRRASLIELLVARRR
jgi:SAM-dependent methyltransferase